MNIRKSPQARRVIAITVSSVLVLGLVVFGLERTGVTDFIKNPTNRSGPTKKEKEAEQKADADTKKNFIENTDEASPTPTPSSSESITVTANQEGDNVTVLTKLQGFSGGNCLLTISNGDKQYTRSAEIIFQPEFSSCAGFSVQVNQLGKGTWDIMIQATPHGGSAISKSITLRVD